MLSTCMVTVCWRHLWCDAKVEREAAIIHGNVPEFQYCMVTGYFYITVAIALFDDWKIREKTGIVLCYILYHSCIQ